MDDTDDDTPISDLRDPDRRDNRPKIMDADLIEQLRSDVKALTGDDGTGMTVYESLS